MTRGSTVIAFYTELATLTLVTAGVTVLALVAWARLSPDPDQAIHGTLQRADGKTVFLFDGMDLVDCTPPARRLWDGLARGGTDLERFFRSLEVGFASLPKVEEVDPSAFQGDFSAKDPGNPLKLSFESWNGYLRATIGEMDPQQTGENDDYLLELSSDELQMLRITTDEAPLLMWHTNGDGSIEWANEAYFNRLAETGVDEAHHWPPAQLFPKVNADAIKQGQVHRVEVGVGNSRRVFDISSLRRGERTLFFAQPADAAAKAEKMQRELVQTFTKTFAQLSIGLAIFDQKRRLALFNPALLTLVRLPADFLTQKPTLHAFLDRMREEKVIAEPKNYRSWRKHLVELEAKASDGSYCETWALPGGMTFRVTGRPHPNGAIAFLFEDISAETTLTRRFHAQIETGQCALDTLDEAIIIINSLGITTLTNSAYKCLFEKQTSESLAPQRLQDHLERWRRFAGEVPEWESLRKALVHRDGPSKWHGNVAMENGRKLSCRMQKLGNGETLIGFQLSTPMTLDFRASRSGQNGLQFHAQSATKHRKAS